MGGVKIPLQKLEKNDVLIFKAKHKVPDHCGVYLENDIFFHHAEHRLSVEKIYILFGQSI